MNILIINGSLLKKFHVFLQGCVGHGIQELQGTLLVILGHPILLTIEVLNSLLVGTKLCGVNLLGVKA